MDDSDAPYAPVGPPGLAAHARSAVVDRGSSCASVSFCGSGIFWDVRFSARSDDVGDRRSRTKRAPPRHTNTADPAMGCARIRDLADELSANQHSLARRGLLLARWKAGPNKGSLTHPPGPPRIARSTRRPRGERPH